MKKLVLNFSLLAILSALLLSACSPKVNEGGAASDAPSNTASQEQSKDAIKIGAAISMTGGTALFGEGVKRGAELAIEEFNAAGGLNGQNATLVLYDDEAKPEKSVEVVQKLINQDKVVALIGPANSGNATAHIKFTQEAKIPEIIPVATGSAIVATYAKEPKNYIFRVSALDSVQVGAILKELAGKQGLKKIGVIHDTEGYGQGGKADIMKQMKENYNLEPAAVSAFDPKELNLEQAVRDMKKAGVEAVMFYGLAPQSAKLLEARNKEGLDAPIYATWATGDPTVVKLVGDLVNKNVFFVQSFTVDQSDKSKAFDKKIIDKYGENVFPVASAQGYDSAKLILEGIKKAGALDGEKIRDAIENINDFEGVTAIKKQPFTKENHEAYGPDDVFIGTYKDSKVVKAS
ncbi:ABC transporter substrate-binding protein [Cohnella kolymensis]|uniref:ABC transporter substrate-binding protein n=1 Tax=Cohnella kolymensis TaxID=1590652 RepID=A0ABR5A4C6_9BACL|nr:ABC transporter substrate-binding protein [Cohnella kolymensis]KIL35573.1 ABC transporter substrate-binding protein [Cohnella kolymensis]